MKAGVPARAARAQAARPPDHQLRGHERDGERHARPRRAARDGARARGGRGDGRASPARSCSTSARSRRTGSRRCWQRAGRRTSAACPSCSTRSAPARRRTGQTRRGGSSTRSTWRCCAATRARSRRSSAWRPRYAASSRSPRAATPADLAREAARSLGVVASVTGPVDHVSDGERVAAIANGDPMLAAITGTGCMSSAVTGCFLAVAELPFDAAVAALVAFGVAGEDAARDAKGPGSFHVEALRRAGRARSRHARRPGAGRMRVHAIVEDVETARRAVDAGATVVQLRVKAPTDEVVERGRGFPGSGRPSSSTTTSTLRSSSARTACISARPTTERSARGSTACCSAARRPPSRRRSRPTRTTWASGRSGRRRRRATPTRRSGSRSSRASAPPSTCR